MKNTIVGIDSGKSGAFAFIKGDEIETVVMPLIDGEIDTRAIADMFLEIRSEIKLVVLESVFAMTKASASGMLTFGMNWGKLEGILVGLKIPYACVPAKTWQKALISSDTSIDTKTRAYQAVSKLYPNVELKATARSTTPHSGLVDSLLIATYGVRYLKSNQ